MTTELVYISINRRKNRHGDKLGVLDVDGFNVKNIQKKWEHDQKRKRDLKLHQRSKMKNKSDSWDNFTKIPPNLRVSKMATSQVEGYVYIGFFFTCSPDYMRVSRSIYLDFFFFFFFFNPPGGG